MAGVKGRSGGHNRKTTAKLKSEGGYRVTRHSDRADQFVKPAAIVPPKYLRKTGKALWNRVVGSLPESLITELDTDSLAMFCQLADMYEKLRPKFAADPINKDVRISFLSVVDRMDKLGRQFGWTPHSRAGLSLANADDKDESAFSALLSRMSGAN
jgi:P27 family predicted phage terminase small subunit